ncbi:hypothetical protein BDI4_1080006 [Burkholderia diffusa]|nr:hypothetical protein BDI4_1080006 [Burkholderia diffusa]
MCVMRDFPMEYNLPRDYRNTELSRLASSWESFPVMAVTIRYLCFDLALALFLPPTNAVAPSRIRSTNLPLQTQRSHTAQSRLMWRVDFGPASYAPETCLEG